MTDADAQERKPDATTTTESLKAGTRPRRYPVFIVVGPDGTETEVQSDKKSLQYWQALAMRDPKQVRAKASDVLWKPGYLPAKVAEGATPSATIEVPSTGNVYFVAPMSPAKPGLCNGDKSLAPEDKEYFESECLTGNFVRVPMVEVEGRDSDGNPTVRWLPEEAVAAELQHKQDVGNALASRAGNAPAAADIPGLIEGQMAAAAAAKPTDKRLAELREQVRKSRSTSKR